MVISCLWHAVSDHPRQRRLGINKLRETNLTKVFREVDTVQNTAANIYFVVEGQLFSVQLLYITQVVSDRLVSRKV
jgi:hypothetical protein